MGNCIGRIKDADSLALEPSSTSAPHAASESFSRLPDELLGKIAGHLPLDVLARFAATNRAANRATAFMLRQAKNVYLQVDRYSARSDTGARNFQKHRRAIATLPKSHQLKPLLRLADKIEFLPSNARLSGLRSVAIQGANMLPEQRDELAQVLKKKSGYLPLAALTTAWQIHAMYRAGVIPEREDWREPDFHWRLAGLRSEERMEAFERTANGVANWLPEERAVGINSLAGMASELPVEERMPAFRRLMVLCADFQEAQKVMIRENVFKKFQPAVGRADLPEIITSVGSQCYSSECDRLDYAMAMLRNLDTFSSVTRVAVFRGLGMLGMEMTPESKGALLKRMMERIGLLPQGDHLKGFGAMVALCASLPDEHCLDMAKHLLTELIRNPEIPPLEGYQLVQSLVRNMSSDASFALLEELMSKIPSLPAHMRGRAATGILADIRKLPPAKMPAALEALLQQFQHLHLFHRERVFESIRALARETSPSSEAQLLAKLARRLPALPSQATLDCLLPLCDQVRNLPEEYRSEVAIALAGQIMALPSSVRRACCLAVIRLASELPRERQAEVLKILPMHILSSLPFPTNLITSESRVA